MSLLQRQITQQLMRQKSTQWSLLISFLTLGLFTALGYQSFIYLQAQNISQLSLYNEVIKPLAGLALISILLVALLSASQIYPYFSARGQQGLWLHSSIKSHRLVKELLLALFKISLIPVVYFALILLVFRIYSPIDSSLLLSSSLGLLLVSLLFSSLLVGLGFLIPKRLNMLLLSGLILMLIFVFDAYLLQHPGLSSFSIFQGLFLNFREGFISVFQLLSFLLWLSLFYHLGVWFLDRLRGQSHQIQIPVILLTLLAIVLFALAQGQFNRQDLAWGYWDISQKKTNSLTEQGLKQLGQIKDQIKITAVIDKDQHRDEIRKVFKLLNQYQQNSQLVFTSRQAIRKTQNDLQVARLGQMDQFVAVEIGGIKLSQAFPFELSAKQSILAMIGQIHQRSEKWISFIEGHGEASPFNKTNRDLSAFYQALKAENWPLAAQNLTNQPMIAKNTQLVIVAASKKPWFAAETKALLEYLKSGGNLLLLREADDHLPQAIIDYIGVEKRSGVLIDWRGYQSGTPHPAVLIVNQFSKHPVNFSIDSLLAFPWSVGLKVKQPVSSNRLYEIVVQSHKGVWNELDSDQEELSFTPEKGEETQSFPVAISVEDPAIKQRIIVVGDSSFLSNGAITNYANAQFAMNLVHWLSESPVEKVTSQHEDHFIAISPLANFIFRWGFSLILPLIMGLWMLKQSFAKRRLKLAKDSQS